MKNIFGFLFCSLLFVFLGCATIIPPLTDSERVQNSVLYTVERIRGLEAKNPEDAMARYNEFLSRNAIEKEREEYSQTLDKDMKLLSKDDIHVISKEASLAFLYVYERKIQGIVEAQLGLSRLYFQKNDLSNAQSHALRAQDVLEKTSSSVSPIFKHKWLIDVHLQLIEINKKRGRHGNVEVSRLTLNTIHDYLRSKKGIDAFYEYKKAYHLSEMRKIDEWIRNVNIYREQLAEQQRSAIYAGIGQLSSAYQQVQINNAFAKSGGVITPEIQRMQQNKMLTDMHAQIAKAQSGSFGAKVEAIINPLTNFTMLQQLTNPDYGANTEKIIQDFTTAISSLTDDNSVKEAARDVSAKAETVAQAKKAGDTQKSFAEGSQLITSLNQLINLVQQK